MHDFDVEEFLRLLRELDDQVCESTSEIDSGEPWRPTKVIPKQVGGVNVSAAKKEDILQLIKGKERIDIGKYMIRIMKETEHTFDIYLYEQYNLKYNTSNYKKIDILTDGRFKPIKLGCSTFNRKLVDISKEDLLVLINWLTKVERLKVFL